MQEEVENRSVNLAITTTKLTARAICSGIRKYLQHRGKVKTRKASDKAEKKAEPIHGKQTVKQLIRQNQGVSSVDIAKSGIRDFERIARRYAVDFAVTKDKSVQPPRYTVFFKAKDADALTAVHKAYSAKIMKKRSRSSVLVQLQKFKALAAGVPRKVREKIQERGR